MRFSLKWALAAMAYVALAAAAFGCPSWVSVELLWTAAILAVCYALIVIGVGRGERQAKAAAFAILWAAYAVCIIAFPHRLPTRRLLSLAGYEPLGSTESAEAYLTLIRALDDKERNTPEAQNLYNMAIGNTRELQAANAVGAMAAGLIGCGLGALAYRRGERYQKSQ